MAVVSLKNTTFIDADGLVHWFPADAGVVTRGGEVDHDGEHSSQVEIDLTALPGFGSGNQQLVAETMAIPKGAFIQEVRILVTKGAVGATATFSLGTAKEVDRSLVGATTLVNAIAVASIASAGTFLKISVGGTGAGSALGTQLADSALLVGSCATANFTQGKLLVDVRWIMPLAADL